MKISKNFGDSKKLGDSLPPRLACFDTEGTTIRDFPQGPCACLYYWDVLTCDVEHSGVTRDNVGLTCSHTSGRDVSSLYSHLHSMLQDAEDGGFYWAVAVHNLTYDAGYLRHFLTHCDELGYSVECTAKGSTSLLSITFRRKRRRVMVLFDTLALFGCSLRTLGSNLGFPKLTMDYSESLAPSSILPATNVAYNTRDTEVLMVAVCRSLLTREGVELADLGSRVLTKTSIVRKSDRESPVIGTLPLSARKSRAESSSSRKVNASRTVYDADRYRVGLHQFRSMHDFQEWASYGDTVTSKVKGFFAGGVNVSNSNHLGQVMHDVVSFDLKSAYPAIMLSYRIPSDPHRVDKKYLDAYSYLLEPSIPDPVDVLKCNTGFWFGTVAFTDVDMDPDWLSSVGDSTVTQTMVLQHFKESSGVVFRDGYVVHADKLVLTLSTPEFFEVCLQYLWEDATFESLVVYKSKERPTHYTVLRTLHHYREKCVAKKVAKAVHKREWPDDSTIDSWVSTGMMTFDEGQALKSHDVDDSWAEAYVMGHKGNLNSLYGIAVTDPMKDDFEIGPDGYLSLVETDTFDNYINSRRDAQMWRESGVCIALFNRYKIAYMARMQVEAGAEVLYIDTDSIKSVGLSKGCLDALYKPLHDKIEQATFELVENCVDDVQTRCSRWMRDTGRTCQVPSIPDDPDFKSLGKLDYEGTFSRFVSTGHKKYCYDEGEGWRVKCSGYNLEVLGDFMAQCKADGFDNLAPLLALGFDNRFDSSTGIATVQTGVDATWADVSFEAVREGGRPQTFMYEGMTCPGYAILDAGKVMNNTEHSPMNVQRFRAACRNNPLVAECSGVDVRRDGEVFTFGKRGCVHMDWEAWDLDWNEGMVER